MWLSIPWEIEPSIFFAEMKSMIKAIKDRDEEVFFLLRVAAEYSSELEAPQSAEEADRYTIISFQITGG